MENQSAVERVEMAGSTSDRAAGDGCSTLSELFVHIMRMFLTLLETVVSGLLQILWKTERVLM